MEKRVGGYATTVVEVNNRIDIMTKQESRFLYSIIFLSDREGVIYYF